MSFLGKVQARCPNGCRPRDVEIWSFIDGGRDGSLRESLLAGDLNLVSCEECGKVFYPEATVIYYDAAAKMLAFVFPESYRSEETLWREKMREDYAQMKKILPGKNPAAPGAGDAPGTAGAEHDLPAVLEPRIYFGIDPLRQQLQVEEDLEAEVEIAELLSRDMELTLYPVDRSFARSQDLPWLLPCRGPASPASAAEGLKSLLKANDRLAGYRRWQKALASLRTMPPGTL
jgi:hypothetical protein